jgi:hypothetical protein
VLVVGGRHPHPINTDVERGHTVHVRSEAVEADDERDVISRGNTR